jgi:hypothetical protein
MVLPITPEATVEIDWDGLGTFAGDHDDVTNDADMTDGAAVSWTEGRNGLATLDPPRLREGSLSLLNHDGRYSQERADSPVYQRVTPGKPVRYRVRHGTSRLYRSATAYRAALPYRGRALYEAARHIIDDISQTAEIGGQRVALSTLGIEAVLTRAPVTVALMTAPRVDECFTALLDAVNWPAAKREIAVSDTTLTYWWCDERNPWDAMLDLVNAEGTGTFYVRGDVFVFENRNFRTTNTRSTTSQATLYDRVDGEAIPYRASVLYRGSRLYRGRTSGLFFTRLDYLPGFKNIYNRATYTTRRRTAGTPGTVIWTYGGTIALSASQVRTIIARPSSGDPFTTAISPALTTDYTIAGGTVTVSLAATNGLVAFITITATSGTPTVSGLQLRATPLTAAGETTVENTVDASASIAKFSPVPGEDIPITLPVQGWPEIDIPSAEAVCDSWVSRYQEQRPQIPIVIRNADGAHLKLILGTRISDRLTLAETNTGLEADVWVNSKEITLSGQGGRIVEAVFGCELVENVGGSVWDDPAALWNTAIWGT